ncbi:MAG TPA: hypothetical protein VD995_13920 [Azospirillum sp.]|nr:hypothetical protein [Azospirillum sp.]
MPRRNRVTPFGALVAVPARGAFLGNRGCLHDTQGIIRRSWATRAWICCLLEFKERRRPLMRPGLYTELFFLDEATALAAGHRPCAECRRADFNRFRAHWTRGNGLAAPPRAPEMDARLHAERVDPSTRTRRLHRMPADVPDGAFVARGEDALLVADGRLHRWSPDGYADAGPLPAADGFALLTPPSAVAALADGYRPQMGI